MFDYHVAPEVPHASAFPDTVSFENVTRGDRNGKDSNSDDLEVLPVRELESCLRLAVPQS
ncbi:hypothetical protein CROQUDRAFT_93110 [Cronartium quercuum f. sp. fusiforme G11]|uniref:Uncharacterized protein n=1 Tax=Cronartium quercuum f. sp. fusiforme G11 TaxID=708437 RepID=A0A9P6TBV1_9BASI|nr:hypothetical protein CROQUDRAFT_93110 [Cronartium quercuum f. sp. fusiforme G11]